MLVPQEGVCSVELAVRYMCQIWCDFDRASSL